MTVVLDRETIISELKNLKSGFAEDFGLTRLALFGSFARNENIPESDIDIVVELNQPDLFALVHIKAIIERNLNHPVDVILNSSFTNPFLKKRIQNEAIDV